jgi:hypothetical protein
VRSASLPRNPQSSAVRASMASPIIASSRARLAPTARAPKARAAATLGVWQNQPLLPPGVAKLASSLRSPNLQLGAVCVRCGAEVSQHAD